MRLSSSNQSLPEAFNASSRGLAPPKSELLDSDVDSPIGASRFFSSSFGRLARSSAVASRNSSTRGSLRSLRSLRSNSPDLRRSGMGSLGASSTYFISTGFAPPKRLEELAGASVFLSASSERFCKFNRGRSRTGSYRSSSLTVVRFDQSPVSARLGPSGSRSPLRLSRSSYPRSLNPPRLSSLSGNAVRFDQSPVSARLGSGSRLRSLPSSS